MTSDKHSTRGKDRPEANSFGLRLTERRAGRSLRELREEIDLSKDTLSRIERGDVPGDLVTFVKLCVYMKVDPATALAELGLWTPEKKT